MATLIKNVRVIDRALSVDVCDDVLISEEIIEVSPRHVDPSCEIIDGNKLILIPGLVDLHVHFREPGNILKEDINSGIKAALAGGVTSALVMPNTHPPIDHTKHVFFQQTRARKTGFHLMVAAAASRDLKGIKETDIAQLKRAGIKAITDDGRAIYDATLMEKVLKLCRAHDVLCMQHAEDLCLSHGHSMNEGRASKRLGMVGQSSHAESSLIARDIALVERIGSRYHVLHLSCRESLKIIQHAKRRKMRVSAEVAPHHLLLSDDDVIGLDTYKKMNPPLRSREDQHALFLGLCDGTIDAVASDHAPHTRKEKKMPFGTAPFGVVGLESAILALITLVNKHDLPLYRAIELMTTGPARILDDKTIGTMLSCDAKKNAVLIDPHCRRLFSARELRGRSNNNAFLQRELDGRVLTTFLNGKIVYRSKYCKERT